MNHGKAFMNGEWLDYKDLTIHASDLGIQRGYGIFDYLRERNGELRYIDSHIDRFFNSVTHANLSFNHSKSELKAILEEMISTNGFGQSGIKFILTGGYSDDGFTPPDSSNFIVINYEGTITYKPGGCALVMDHFLRPNPDIKTIQYFNSALLYHKIKKYQAVDVLYHYKGEVSECAKCNFYIIKDGTVITAAKNVLHGITRKRLIEKCSSKYPFEFRPIRTEEIYTCDEMFITSTTKDVLPITQIEDHTVGNGQIGAITQSLIHDFNDL